MCVCVCVHVCVCVCVCESGRSPDAIRPRLKRFFFSAELRLDATSGSPPALPAKAPVVGKRERFYKVWYKN